MSRPQCIFFFSQCRASSVRIFQASSNLDGCVRSSLVCKNAEQVQNSLASSVNSQFSIMLLNLLPVRSKLHKFKILLGHRS